jgi:hypothetical protein
MILAHVKSHVVFLNKALRNILNGRNMTQNGNEENCPMASFVTLATALMRLGHLHQRGDSIQRK